MLNVDHAMAHPPVGGRHDERMTDCRQRLEVHMPVGLASDLFDGGPHLLAPQGRLARWLSQLLIVLFNGFPPTSVQRRA